MKTILCYGDSNTWGYKPDGTGRYPRDQRWTGVLQRTLGDEYEVISEGLNGRTTVWDDPVRGDHRNGKKYLLPCLHSHKPIDLVILFLGSNDLKPRFHVSPLEIAQSVEMLVGIIQKSETGPDAKPPGVLVVVPPPVLIPPGVKPSDYHYMEYKKAVEKSRYFPRDFAKVLDGVCSWIDASKIVRTSETDGMHLDAKDHFALGKALSKIVAEGKSRPATEMIILDKTIEL